MKILIKYLNCANFSSRGTFLNRKRKLVVTFIRPGTIRHLTPFLSSCARCQILPFVWQSEMLRIRLFRSPKQILTIGTLFYCSRDTTVISNTAVTACRDLIQLRWFLYSFLRSRSSSCASITFPEDLIIIGTAHHFLTLHQPCSPCVSSHICWILATFFLNWPKTVFSAEGIHYTLLLLGHSSHLSLPLPALGILHTWIRQIAQILLLVVEVVLGALWGRRRYRHGLVQEGLGAGGGVVEFWCVIFFSWWREVVTRRFMSTLNHIFATLRLKTRYRHPLTCPRSPYRRWWLFRRKNSAATLPCKHLMLLNILR